MENLEKLIENHKKNTLILLTGEENTRRIFRRSV